MAFLPQQRSGGFTLVEAMVDFQGKSVPAIRMRAPPRNSAPARQPQRQTVDADGYDDRPEPPPRREAPPRNNDDINDDIPF